MQLAGAAADRALVPSVKGMTDELTMANWDPPFPFDAKRIRPADEKYWNRYGPTPKAFVSLATGRRLWASRFGQTTSLRVASKNCRRRLQSPIRRRAKSIGDWSRLLQQHLDPAAMGFAFQPIRQQQLAASEGRDAVRRPLSLLQFFHHCRRRDAGRLAVSAGDRPPGRSRSERCWPSGCRNGRCGECLLGEGLAVAAAGSLLGVPAGIGYAALMLLGLQTWWLAAIATPFLRLHVTAASLAIGCASGIAVADGAIWLSVRRIARVPPRRLLAGRATSGKLRARLRRRSACNCPNGSQLRVEIVLLLLAVAPTAVAAAGSCRRAVADRHVLRRRGMTALAALLALVWLRLRAGMTGRPLRPAAEISLRMALRNAARNPGRSTLTIGLVAAACVSSSCRWTRFASIRPSKRRRSHSGNGGFALVAESDQPILARPRFAGRPNGPGLFGGRPEAAGRQHDRLVAGSCAARMRVA